MRAFLSIFCLIVSWNLMYSCTSVPDSIIIQAIESGDIQAFSQYLDQDINVNGEYGDAELTLLALCIEGGQTSMAELLLQKGADPEQISDRKTPMMFAAKNNRVAIVPILLSGGANINTINRQEYSALHYAAKYGNLEIIKVLCDNGAALNLQNDDQWTAMDFAIISKRSDIEDYLVSRGGRIYNKTLPSFTDGPHMQILQDGKLKVFYLVHDSIEQISRVISESNDSVSEENPFIVDMDCNPPPSEYKNVSRILAIGDIHGEYDRMVLTLKNAGVIDDNLQWQWGDGHLVFTGDILDRGNHVTECLWLIYNLEKQAIPKNGKVHLLLGNHEMMILNGDLRYISNWYYGITSNLDMDYSLLYAQNTVLGRWLRSKNGIEKINDLIFVHAGISPQFTAKNISIDSANVAIRAFLNGGSDSYSQEFNSFLTGNLGPVWYRGYTGKSRGHSKITPDELENILSAYNGRSIIVGHTETDSIMRIDNSPVIDINIPLWNRNVPEQALFIEGERFDVIYRDRARKLITQF